MAAETWQRYCTPSLTTLVNTVDRPVKMPTSPTKPRADIPAELPVIASTEQLGPPIRILLSERSDGAILREKAVPREVHHTLSEMSSEMSLERWHNSNSTRVCIGYTSKYTAAMSTGL